MRNAKAWIFTAVLATAALANAPEAAACGGCFVSQSENTVVTGHKMILSISQQQTTLYDQIVYSGDPSSFAWILPVKGTANVGLSSDALFQALDQDTTVTLNSPTITCAPPPDCGFTGGGFPGADGGSGGGSGVTVVAQKTVGPYETVQLASTDPHALSDWLAQHGYTLPADIQPIIDAYVGEGFDFLALKLVPGQGVSAMRPVRITTPGASAVLPLRMVAAGTGAITPITLWVMAEGRYDTVNLPSFQIDANKLQWDWDTSSSNYKQLKQDGFTASNNQAWLIQAGEPFSKFFLNDTIMNSAMFDPVGSGYADDMGNGATQAATDDLTALYGTIPDASLWVTRLTGELSRAALAADLQLGAASNQTPVQRFFQINDSIGTPPSCPTFPPCDPGVGGSGGAGGAGGEGGGWSFWGTGGASTGGGSSGGCAMTGGDGVPMLSGLALMAALAFARRRRPAR